MLGSATARHVKAIFFSSDAVNQTNSWPVPRHLQTDECYELLIKVSLIPATFLFCFEEIGPQTWQLLFLQQS